MFSQLPVMINAPGILSPSPTNRSCSEACTTRGSKGRPAQGRDFCTETPATIHRHGSKDCSRTTQGRSCCEACRQEEGYSTDQRLKGAPPITWDRGEGPEPRYFPGHIHLRSCLAVHTNSASQEGDTGSDPKVRLSRFGKGVRIACVVTEAGSRTTFESLSSVFLTLLLFPSRRKILNGI